MTFSTRNSLNRPQKRRLLLTFLYLTTLAAISTTTTSHKLSSVLDEKIVNNDGIGEVNKGHFSHEIYDEEWIKKEFGELDCSGDVKERVKKIKKFMDNDLYRPLEILAEAQILHAYLKKFCLGKDHETEVSIDVEEANNTESSMYSFVEKSDMEEDKSVETKCDNQPLIKYYKLKEILSSPHLKTAHRLKKLTEFYYLKKNCLGYSCPKNPNSELEQQMRIEEFVKYSPKIGRAHV